MIRFVEQFKTNDMKTTYNKSEILKAAWEIKSNSNVTFSIALKAAWCKAKNNVNEVFNAAGIMIAVFTKGQRIFLQGLRLINPFVLQTIIFDGGSSNPITLEKAYSEQLDLFND